MEFEYNRQEKRLLGILEGREPSPQEAVDVLGHLIGLGVEEVVASMIGFFDPHTIVDFVWLSRLYGEGEKRYSEKGLGRHDIFSEIRKGPSREGEQMCAEPRDDAAFSSRKTLE
jgi:hypothetical protein